MDAYLIHDREDPLHSSLCFGKEQTAEILDNFRHPSRLRVWRITPDELSRDVTADFIADEPIEPDETDDYCHADDIGRLWRRGY